MPEDLGKSSGPSPDFLTLWILIKDTTEGRSSWQVSKWSVVDVLNPPLFVFVEALTKRLYA